MKNYIYALLIVVLYVFGIQYIENPPGFIVHKIRPPTLRLENFSEQSEKRVAAFYNEYYWPKESLDTLHSLLDEYERLHADILKQKNGKYIRWTCSWWCFGWGDRIRGILTVLTLAIIHKRAFVIELNQVGVELNELYDPSRGVDWSKLPGNVTSEGTVECLIPGRSCECIQEGIINHTDAQMISVHTNLDCSGYYSSQLKGWKHGIEYVLNWRGILMDRVFPLSNKLRTMIQQTIPMGMDVSMHIRTGFIHGRDYIRYSGTPQELQEKYTLCLNKVYGNDDAIVYIASDNATFESAVRNALNVTVLNSSWIGELGHVQQDQSGGPMMVWRMMVDFEILRRSTRMLVGPSGFSAFAFKSRVFAHAKAYAPIAVNDVKECEQVFQNHMFKSYWLDANR